jgi:hypothetical protein
MRIIFKHGSYAERVFQLCSPTLTTFESPVILQYALSESILRNRGCIPLLVINSLNVCMHGKDIIPIKIVI